MCASFLASFFFEGLRNFQEKVRNLLTARRLLLPRRAASSSSSKLVASATQLQASAQDGGGPPEHPTGVAPPRMLLSPGAGQRPSESERRLWLQAAKTGNRGLLESLLARFPVLIDYQGNPAGIGNDALHWAAAKNHHGEPRRGAGHTTLPLALSASRALVCARVCAMCVFLLQIHEPRGRALRGCSDAGVAAGERLVGALHERHAGMAIATPPRRAACPKGRRAWNQRPLLPSRRPRPCTPAPPTVLRTAPPCSYDRAPG